ncbi:kil1 [Symbiodinium microadriaticum]|nr:kil1 [Symbiodinium microadriaticum]
MCITSLHVDMNFYHSELDKYPSLITGESTPSYLLHSDIVIPRVRTVLPFADVRFLVMLRDPVSRAYSQYHMAIDATGSPEQMKVRGQTSYVGKTFSEVIEEEIAKLILDGVTPDCSYEVFHASALVDCPMTHGGHSIVARGLYALQLLPWMEHFADHIKILSLSDIKGAPDQVQETLNGVFSFIGLPTSELTDFEAKNTRTYPDVEPEVKQRLADFYRPYNERLYELIGRDLSW